MNLAKLAESFNKRHHQIEHEANLDRAFDKLPCKETLYNYYRFRRLFNRLQYHHFHDAKMWDKLSVGAQHLEEVDGLDAQVNRCIQNVSDRDGNQDKKNVKICQCIGKITEAPYFPQVYYKNLPSEYVKKR